MPFSRIKTLLIGLAISIPYGLIMMGLATLTHNTVSISYIFFLPVILGAIPVLFSRKDQLDSYINTLLVPWGIVITFFFLAWALGFEGMICLTIIIAPFILLATLGAFIFRLIKLNRKHKDKRLYACLLLPFLALFIEQHIEPKDQYGVCTTSIEINAAQQNVWEQIKNVPHIRPEEVNTHFIHLIGIPKPISAQLDKDGIGGTRFITWEKGIRFREKIKSWEEGKSFSYDIDVDPASIPPATLDEHVMVGGKYFDVIDGSYHIEKVSETRSRILLTCRYRTTTTLNAYSQWWASFVLNDFHQMILEVVKKRSEQ